MPWHERRLLDCVLLVLEVAVCLVILVELARGTLGSFGPTHAVWYGTQEVDGERRVTQHDLGIASDHAFVYRRRTWIEGRRRDTETVYEVMGLHRSGLGRASLQPRHERYYGPGERSWRPWTQRFGREAIQASVSARAIEIDGGHLDGRLGPLRLEVLGRR